MIWVKCADKGLESISFWDMSAAAGIGATSISTIEGTLRSSRFYDSKYPLKINWIIATQLENDKDSGLNWRLMLIENVSCDCIKRVTHNAWNRTCLISIFIISLKFYFRNIINLLLLYSCCGIFLLYVHSEFGIKAASIVDEYNKPQRTNKPHHNT